MNLSEFPQIVINCLQDAIFVTDERENIVYANQTACEMTGFSMRELMKMTGSDMAARCGWPVSWKTKEKGNPEKRQRIETEIRSRSGSLVFAEILTTRLVIDNQEYDCVIVRDNAQYRAAEEKLMAAKRQAEAAVQAKSEFLACVSHEIRTPLNVLLGSCTLLQKLELTQEQSGLANNIRLSGDILMSLIDDILELSRVESGKLNLKPAPMAVRRCMDDAVSLIACKAAQKNLTLRTDIGDDVPEIVEGDPLRLQQVLTNLLSNAVKFTDTGEINLRCKIRSRTETDVLLEFAISDTGIGISKEACERIFENFIQLNTPRPSRGVGLGLSICSHLVQLMGGQLRVESEPGAGSTFAFEIRFPLHHGEPVQNALMSVGFDPDLGKHFPLSILIAEDNRLNAQLLRQILGKFGYDPDIAGDGRQAVEACRKKPYHALFLDIHMPEMDGFEAARNIRDSAEAPQPFIIAVTASEDLKQGSAPATIDAYLSKPYPIHDIRQCLALVIDRTYSQNPS